MGLVDMSAHGLARRLGRLVAGARGSASRRSASTGLLGAPGGFGIGFGRHVGKLAVNSARPRAALSVREGASRGRPALSTIATGATGATTANATTSTHVTGAVLAPFRGIGLGGGSAMRPSLLARPKVSGEERYT